LCPAPAPAERAAITAAVAFIAILVDRQAISLRTLAVAALIILAIQPEAAVAPGFQMSFAATAALVALAEGWPRPVKEISTPWWIRWPQAGMTWLAASVAASLVAGLATAPFAMQHFNRVAVWGLPANLLVAPLSSFVIMPFLAIGALLEPLGLGVPFLAVAGWWWPYVYVVTGSVYLLGAPSRAILWLGAAASAWGWRGWRRKSAQSSDFFLAPAAKAAPFSTNCWNSLRPICPIGAMFLAMSWICSTLPAPFIALEIASI